MSDEIENPTTSDARTLAEPIAPARVAALERKVYWLKLGVIVLVVALIALFIPPIATAIGFLLLVAVIVGGVIVLIASVMYLLDRFFPNDGPPKS